MSPHALLPSIWRDFRTRESFLRSPAKSAPSNRSSLFKSGKSDIGSTAALSHTGSVAGSDALYDGAFKQAGIIRARNILEFYDTVRAFAKQPVPEGNRVSYSRIWADPGQSAWMSFPRPMNCSWRNFHPRRKRPSRASALRWRISGILTDMSI